MASPWGEAPPKAVMRGTAKKRVPSATPHPSLRDTFPRWGRHETRLRETGNNCVTVGPFGRGLRAAGSVRTCSPPRLWRHASQAKETEKTADHAGRDFLWCCWKEVPFVLPAASCLPFIRGQGRRNVPFPVDIGRRGAAFPHRIFFAKRGSSKRKRPPIPLGSSM